MTDQFISMSDLARTMVMNTLIGALTQPAGKIDREGAVELVQQCLITHVWAVREEAARRMRDVQVKGHAITDNTIASMVTVSSTERQENMTRLLHLLMFNVAIEGMVYPSTTKN